MKRICSATLSRAWEECSCSLAKLSPGAGAYIRSTPQLLRIVREAIVGNGLSTAEADTMLLGGTYDESLVKVVAAVLLEKAPDELAHVLEDTPVFEIAFTDGTSDTISRIDLLCMGLADFENVSAAWLDQHLLISMSWAGEQGGRTWIWNSESREVVWQTEEDYGTTALLPGQALFIIHECHSTYVNPPTNGLVVISPGPPVVCRQMSLDNIRWEVHGLHHVTAHPLLTCPHSWYQVL